MPYIEFEKLQECCYYRDLFLKHLKDGSIKSINYCDNKNRHNESRCERYCEEKKCPLLSYSK